MDVLDAVSAEAGTSLADRIDASAWRIELPGIEPEVLARGGARRSWPPPKCWSSGMTKQGRRTFDARGAVATIEVIKGDGGTFRGLAAPCAILDLVVRQVTPSVRPDDVLSGLRVVADLEPPVPPAGDPAGTGPADGDGGDRRSVGGGSRSGA